LIVLDTHAWIWWVAMPEQLSDKAKQAIAWALSLSAQLVTKDSKIRSYPHVASIW
jgi:PIN domain nuclease of toxin-antitoxin system